MTEEKKEELTEAKATETKPTQTTDINGFKQFIEALEPLAKMYMAYKDKEAEAKMKEADARIKYFQQATKHNRNVLYTMTFFLLGVIAFMSVLTWVGKVSGDALLFLVGTVVGYLILFIQRLARPTEEEPIEEEE